MMMKQIDYMSNGYWRTFSLFLFFVLGAFLPQAHIYSFLIQYLIMLMLFLAFLDTSLNWKIFNKSVFMILVANISLAILSYFALVQVNYDLAIIAFITAITPTAIAAPVIIELLDGRVEYVVASVILTNSTIALLLPFILPLIVDSKIDISTLALLKNVSIVIFFPLIIAQLTKRFPPKVQQTMKKLKSASFYLWLIVLFLATSNASYFMRNESTFSLGTLLSSALISLIICISNFTVGWFLGGKMYRKEASQSLGQKNNALTIWISLTFLNPIVALGPTFYVIYHNVYNSYQLFKKQRKDKVIPRI